MYFWIWISEFTRNLIRAEGFDVDVYVKVFFLDCFLLLEAEIKTKITESIVVKL